VPDPQDPATQLNIAFLDTLVSADRIYICGEAGSHCVKASTEHIADYLQAQQGREALAKLVLLTDCMSPVPGFEAQQEAFVAAMLARGARLATSTEILPELLANQAA
jgi:nicotinamidase-related amidase